MNFFKRIYVRLIKNIEIHNISSISLSSTATISNSSILNASQGKIILGANSRVGNSSEIVSAKNKTIEIKDYSTLYSNCKILGSVIIERYCVLATNIYMSSGNHFAFEHPELLIRKQDQLVREENTDINKPIHIHEDVWIGNGVFISQGITIGRGAVIGAGTIVTKDILPYQVVVGNPGKPIKNRLDFVPPLKIDANNQNDRPYFYQGFDHLNSFPDQHKNGFPLLDIGIVYLAGNTSLFTFSGYSSSKSEITISIGSQSQKYTITKGDFNFSFRNDSPTNGSYSVLTLTTLEKLPHLFIQSIIGKTI